MRGYSIMSDEERNSILQQHSAFYNGYATTTVPSGPQPLLQDNGVSNYKGITVNNKGEVSNYKNHLVNESTEEVKGRITGDGREEEPMRDDEDITLPSNDDDFEDIESLDIKEYVADDMDVSDVEPDFDFESGGSGQFEDEGDDFETELEFDKKGGSDDYDFSYSDDSYGLDLDSIMSMFDGSLTADLDDELDGTEEYEDEIPAYEFDSEGEMDVDLYEEEQCEGCGSEIYEEGEMCEVCGGEMREGECVECGGMYEEIDEDLRESFFTEKDRISEMFDRFKKFN